MTTGLSAAVTTLARMSRVKRKIRALKARRRASGLAARPLLEWVPALSPEYQAPEHLGPIVAELEKARTQRVQMCFSVPPGHWKSVTLHHWIALMLAANPALRIGYGTYDRTFANEQVANIRSLVGRAKVAIGRVDRQGVFTTKARGRVMGFGLQKPPTGRRFDIIIVDDPYSSRAEAESSTIRMKVERGFTADLMTRQVAGGSTVIVLHTRWHPDDLIGTLVKAGWLYINIPAEDAAGVPLLPRVWTREMLDKQRAASEYDWWSLFMGQPRPPGGTIFLDAPTLVDEWEKAGAFHYVCGLDIARGEKQKNDANAYAMTRRATGDKSKTPTMDFLDWLEEPGPIADVEQIDERTSLRTFKPGFLRHLVRMSTLYPGVIFCMSVGRTETNMLELMSAAAAVAGVRIKIHPLEAQGQKLWNRAEAGYAPAWNAGRVRVPRKDPRSGALILSHKNFVGGHYIDHLISAATSAYDWHAGKRSAGWNGTGAGRPQTSGEGSEADRGGRYL